MDQRSRATYRAAQRRDGSTVDAGASMVFVVCGTARLAGRGDEQGVAFEEKSRFPEKIDA
jgi:hypothetical protein